MAEAVRIQCKQQMKELKKKKKNALDRKRMHPEIGAFEFDSCLWIDKMERIKTAKEIPLSVGNQYRIAVTANIYKIL